MSTKDIVGDFTGPRSERDDLPTVLIVDDDLQVRRLVRRFLERSGRFGEIWEAEDAADGVFQARRNPPDVIVLDYGLPFLTGAAAKPYFASSAPHAKIVGFSGAPADGPKWFDAYLVKDDADRLVETLLAVLEQDDAQAV